MKKDFLVFAHRGASALAPENTLAAFRKAIELGADGLELDVQMTRDGVLVVFHDEWVDRTTNGKGLLRNYTLNELRKLDAGTWFSPEFSGEKVPTLAEVFQLVNGRKILLNLEIKTNYFPYPEIENRIIKVIRVYSLASRTIISSFNHLTLFRCKGLAPEIKTGLIYAIGIINPWVQAGKLGAEFLFPPHRTVTGELVWESQRRNLRVIPYTVNEVKNLKKLREMGVDGIISDKLFGLQDKKIAKLP